MSTPQPPPPHPHEPGRRPLHSSKASKRGRVPETKKRRGKDLEQELLLLEARYPDFARLINLATDAVHNENERTPASDRNLVVSAIEMGNNAVDDICDETNLTRHAVQLILDDMIERNFLERRNERNASNDVQKARVLYFFVRSPL